MVDNIIDIFHQNAIDFDRVTFHNICYLYTEYSDDELYEGQVTLRDIVKMLPDFVILELWPDDNVLLKNTRLSP